MAELAIVCAEKRSFFDLIFFDKLLKSGHLCGRISGRMQEIVNVASKYNNKLKQQYVGAPADM